MMLLAYEDDYNADRLQPNANELVARGDFAVTLGDFSKQADYYRSSRPTYPVILVALLIQDAQVVAGDAVADFGAGTGIFTCLLIERGFRVTAIEPNAAMRNQNHVPKAHWVDGTFESSGLGDASQRWAVAAQAFHWADFQRSLPEVRRVLQPGRLFTVLWNNRENRESEILSWTENAIRRHVPDYDEAYRSRPWQAILESTGDFSFVKHRTVSHRIRMSRERYLNLWRSHNRLNTLAGPERFQSLLLDISEYLKQRGLDELDVPYRCEAWSAVRK
jgi:SAM-dependent methyltransferase